MMLDMPRRRRSRRDSQRWRSRLVLEPLEHRLAPAANLRLTQALLVNPADIPIIAPVHGEMVSIRAEWTTTDLTAADRYVVRVEVDGVALESAPIAGTPGAGVPRATVLSGWFAAPGPHAVTVLVDATQVIAETDETDNTHALGFTPTAPTSLPSRFLVPIAGTPTRDWNVGYIDVDPRPGQVRDYRGGNYVPYDGHTGYDIGPPNFASMDVGVPVYAAAAGTVTQVQDGYFDREITLGFRPPNWVQISHGNGWVTEYYHFARHTIPLRQGDPVRAGQLLGLVGSSGNSGGAHLHFQILHDGAVVESGYDLASYWYVPILYQGTAPPRLLDSGVTNYPAFGSFELLPGEFFERPSYITTYPPSTPSVSLRFYHEITHVNSGDEVAVHWHRPDGTQVATSSMTASATESPFWRFWFFYFHDFTAPEHQGTWQVATRVNGVELGRTSFVVAAAPVVPEIHVTQGSTYLLDERTTPLDFGTASLGGTPPQRTFSVRNHGYAPLTLGGLVLPPGFALVGAFPPSVAPGATATFTVRLDTARAGVKFGQLRFTTNDPDEGVFNFNLEGTVIGAPPAGAPLLTLPGPALASRSRATPRVLAGAATLADADSSNFNGGSLRVEFAAGGTADDRLAIRYEGDAPGQIGVRGAAVTYGGTEIGTFTGGTGLTPLVVTFNAAATVPAVQALVRNITYAHAGRSLMRAFRYVRFTAVDDTGQVSNQPIQVVVVEPMKYLTRGVLQAVEAFPTAPWPIPPFRDPQRGVLPAGQAPAWHDRGDGDGGNDTISRGSSWETTGARRDCAVPILDSSTAGDAHLFPPEDQITALFGLGNDAVEAAVLARKRPGVTVRE